VNLEHGGFAAALNINAPYASAAINVVAGWSLLQSTKVSGTVVTSDLRLKKNMTPIPRALEFICSLHGVRFNWKKDGSPCIGLIAQDAEITFSELVVEKDDTKNLNYNGITACLVEAVKAQQLQIAELQQRIH
jgi:hypothetical protein